MFETTPKRPDVIKSKSIQVETRTVRVLSLSCFFYDQVTESLTLPHPSREIYGRIKEVSVCCANPTTEVTTPPGRVTPDMSPSVGGYRIRCQPGVMPGVVGVFGHPVGTVPDPSIFTFNIRISNLFLLSPPVFPTLHPIPITTTVSIPQPIKLDRSNVHIRR